MCRAAPRLPHDEWFARPDAVGWFARVASTERPTFALAGALSRSQSALTVRDLPIPGSPEMSATWPSPDRALSNRLSSKPTW